MEFDPSKMALTCDDKVSYQMLFILLTLIVIVIFIMFSVSANPVRPKLHTGLIRQSFQPEEPRPCNASMWGVLLRQTRTLKVYVFI